jgi:hypothetical protein
MRPTFSLEPGKPDQHSGGRAPTKEPQKRKFEASSIMTWGANTQKVSVSLVMLMAKASPDQK